MLTTSPTSQFTIIDTPSGIQITWPGRKDWGRFTSNAFTILINLVVVGIIAYSAWAGLSGQLAAQVSIWIMLAILSAYMFYRIIRRSKDLIGSLLEHEVIRIESQAVTIERSGFLTFERRAVYPGDRIRSIRATFLGSQRALFLAFTVGGDILTRYRLGVDQVFCRGINETDAAATLTKIHERFPQYRDIKP